jgi:uncharacterized membrane protein YbhN (UPF0104 family)
LWLLSKVDIQGAWAKVLAIDPWMLALSVVLMLVQLTFGAARWGVVLRALNAKLGAVKIFLLYYVGAFFAIVLPGLVGGDAVRVWATVRAGEPLVIAVNSVMLERASAVLSLLVLVAVTEPLLLARVPDLPGPWVFPLLTLGAVAGIVVLSVMDHLPEKLMRWRAVRALAYLAADTRRVAFHAKTGLSAFGAALLGNINLSLVMWALAVGLHIPVDVVDCLVLVPPVFLVTTLPSSIAGWGVREAAMVTSFGFIGIDGGQSLLLSLVFGILNMVIALPGGIAFLMVGDHSLPKETAGFPSPEGQVE